MCPNKGLSQAPKEKVQLCLKKVLAWRRRPSRPLEALPPPLSRLLGSPFGLCFALHISIFSWSRAIFSSTLMYVAALHHPPNSPHIHIDRYTHVDTHTLTAPEFINLQVCDLQSLEKHPWILQVIPERENLTGPTWARCSPLIHSASIGGLRGTNSQKKGESGRNSHPDQEVSASTT